MKVDISALCEDAAIALAHNCDSVDPYQITCVELADVYGLWEEGRKTPPWLSYLVQGIARDGSFVDLQALVPSVNHHKGAARHRIGRA